MANNSIDRQLDQIEGDEPAQDEAVTSYTKVYQVYPNSKIPVSKQLGKMWQARHKEGVGALSNSGAKDRWDEAIRYYQNDQGGQSGRKSRLGEVATGSEGEKKYATENIVFANVSALVPSIYAKNPDIEISTSDSDQEAKAAMYEALADALISKKVSPGINLKPKMRRGTILGMLTNLAYFELSYVKKEQSSDAAMQEIMQLSEQLEEAKTTKELMEIEGKLQALDEKISLLSNSGPRMRVRAPHALIIDPTSEEVDLSDANYVIVEDYLRTDFLRAVYGEKDENGNWKSIYEPSHVIKADVATNKNINGHDEEINSFSIIDDEAGYKKYGYNNEAEYKNAQRTKVQIVWDKVTRRVIMFNDKDWSMPIWVWDDPYNLTRFYPFFTLAFYTDPVQRYARSEVTYYLDQQDEINTINNERARMRHWIMTKVFVNTTAIKDATIVEEFLTDNKQRVKGVQLPEGAKIGDAIGTLAAPSTAFEGLFDTGPIMQSVNRLSSVTPVLQNEQYKTNTTNKAIESYESSTQTRLDEKIDAIEDVLSDIGIALIEMCIQFMTEDEVVALIGTDIVKKAGGWPMDMRPDQFHEQFQFKIVGGSTLKPTSKVKKDQALNIAQVLGQFASASPVSILLAMKAIQRAFNEDMTITAEEWELLINSVMQAIGALNKPAASANGGGRPPQQGGEQAQGDDQVIAAGAEALGQIIDGLPPEVKAKVGELISQGVPLKEIIAQLAQQ